MTEKAFKKFNAQAMLDNVDSVQELIQRIRQKDGVGSEQDELMLHRIVQDMSLLIDMIDDARRNNKELQEQVSNIVDPGLKQHYEEMVRKRDERIQELENKLDE